jgi:hypothetical protein
VHAFVRLGLGDSSALLVKVAANNTSTKSYSTGSFGDKFLYVLLRNNDSPIFITKFAEEPRNRVNSTPTESVSASGHCKPALEESAEE